MLSFVVSLLSSCGGGGGSSTSSSSSSNTIQQATKITTGVAQKGPFSINTPVEISRLNSVGQPTGDTISAKVSANNGEFSFQLPAEWDTAAPVNLYLKARGKVFDESLGIELETPITLTAITQSTDNESSLNSVNILTHWQAQRTQTLLAEGKGFNQSLKQANDELVKVFGIDRIHSLDFSSSDDESNSAMLLLLSGVLMEVARAHQVEPQSMIDQIGDDFSNDGNLSAEGDQWFLRMQAAIKDNPIAHAKKYAKRLQEKQAIDVVSVSSLPRNFPLASRPVANVPAELFASPGETIVLDGSGSHDSGNIINFTWFRVDQQTQYPVPVSDRFDSSPTITVPSEAEVLAAPNQEIALLYALVVTDEAKLTHTGVVKVIVKKTPIDNTPPLAEPQQLTTDEDVPLKITLTGSDEDGDPIVFNLNTPLSTANGIIELDPDLGSALPNVVYTSTKDYFGSDSFTFLVNDGFESSNVATVDIQITPVNDPPEADADEDQIVESSQTVLLNGLGSTDVDGTVEAYLWQQQPGGSVVSLSDVSDSNPSFTAPAVSSVSETLIFDLVVTDNDGAESAVDTVEITINPLNEAPIAIAGDDQEVFSGDLVNLNGSGTDVDGDVVGFLWAQSSGSAVSLSNTGIAAPGFTAPTVQSAPEILIFNLIVTDNDGAKSVSDSVEIVVNPPGNNMPVANAGLDQAIASVRTSFGSGFQEATLPITLDGSGSSDLEDPISDLRFNWTQVSGPVAVDPDDDIKPVFNIVGGSSQVISGDYVFKLEVTDSGNLVSDPDEITITVGPNQPPIADDLFIPIDLSGNPTSITLVGNDPDGNNANLTYEVLTQPITGNLTVTYTDNILEYQPYSISSPEIDSFTYRVVDELGLGSNVATVNLTEPNTPPTANAGYFSGSAVALVTGDPSNPVGFEETSVITLDGSYSSDAEDANTDLSYQWSQMSGPITIPVADIPQVMEPSFTIINTNVSQSIVGEYVFQLVVTDRGGLISVADQVSFFISLPNPSVIALPGEDRDEIELTTVQLYGSGSAPQGLDNSTFVWEWTQIDIIPGTEIDLVFDPTYQRYTPTFIAPAVTVPTEIKLQLIVFDNEFGFSEPAVVVITIYPTGTILTNVKPTAVDQNVITNANGSLSSVSLLGDDPDGDNRGLTYRVIGLSDDTRGRINSISYLDVIGVNPRVFYEPFYPVLENTLTYVAIDQDGAESDPATVIFTPLTSPPGNTAPVAQSITIDIDPPLSSSNSRYILDLSTLIQDADGDEYIIDVISQEDTQVNFTEFSGNSLRMDNNSRTSAATGSYTYRAIDIYGNASAPATITINYNE